MENKVAPAVHHALQPFDRFSMKKLCDIEPSLLPDRWRELMLNHLGAHHRSKMKSSFALRPQLPKTLSFSYNLTGITALPELTVPTSLTSGKRQKFSGNPRKKSKKTELVIAIPQNVENNQIVLTSHTSMEDNRNSDPNQSAILPTDCPDQLNLGQVINVPPTQKTPYTEKEKEAHSDSAITDVELEQVIVFAFI